jgi:hypothetical protein
MTGRTILGRKRASARLKYLLERIEMFMLVGGMNEMSAQYLSWYRRSNINMAQPLQCDLATVSQASSPCPIQHWHAVV